MTNDHPWIPGIPGLAEKVAVARKRDRRMQRRYLAAIVVGVLLVGGGVLYVVSELGQRNAPAKATIDVSKLPPIQPGPQR